jgi:hypothetical protein
MAEALTRKTKRKNRTLKTQDLELDRFDSLPWNSSFPQPTENDDKSFSLFTGSNELEGGSFVSLVLSNTFCFNIILC